MAAKIQGLADKSAQETTASRSIRGASRVQISIPKESTNLKACPQVGKRPHSNLIFSCKKTFDMGPEKGVRGVVGRGFLGSGGYDQVQSISQGGPGI